MAIKEIWSKRFLIYLALTSGICVINGHINSSSSRLFSRNFTDFQTLRTFSDVSIATCERKCRQRWQCKGLIYNRRATVCVLIARLPEKQTVDVNVGTVLVTDLNRASKNIQTCAKTKCEWWETCIATEHGEACKVTECGPPPGIYTNIHGNMYAVNNEIIINWGSRRVGITCGPDGMWHTNNSKCLPGMKPFENSCYYLDLKTRTHGEARVFCESLVPSAHLADVNSEEENKFLKRLFNGVKSRAYAVWLGGWYNKATGLYYWSDGTPINDGTPPNDGYQSWGPMEPSNRINEYCVAAKSGYEYDWNDATCDKPFCSVCEFGPY